MRPYPSIETVSEETLRAWADAGEISSARFVEEMERRRGESRAVIESPPLDYDLDIELYPEDLQLDPSELAIAGEDEELSFASRPMFGLIEGGLIVATALIGVGLLVWGFWNWPVTP